MEQAFHHVPIMVREILEQLDPQPGGVYLDGTLGGGGHAQAVLSRIAPTGRLVGIDRDEEALDAARSRLAEYGDALTTLHGNYKDAPALLSTAGIDTLQGALLDLGVSSWQLDSAQRGFSYQADAPLDMRMDRSQQLTAWDVVNTYSQDELRRLIYRYGEERWAPRIAEFIVKERARAPIDTTGALVETIYHAIPAGARRKGPHPAKRTFQAIRIEVNGELSGLSQAIEDIAGLLAQGGVLCVITFHSLEDRAVKEAMKRMEHPCTCPPKAPVCTCGKQPLGRMIPRKPIEPSDQEIEVNPRARSAKLRVFHKKIEE
jgi:16S rRNA (cytosine1402-N4)-methyltransferase